MVGHSIQWLTFWKVEQLIEERCPGHYFQGVSPGGLGAGHSGIRCHQGELLPEQDDDTIHDSHDQVGRAAQLPDRRDVGRLDGVQRLLSLLQGRLGSLQLDLCNNLLAGDLGKKKIIANNIGTGIGALLPNGRLPGGKAGA